jgi:hypothetical protein
MGTVGDVYNRGTKGRPVWYCRYKDADGRRKNRPTHMPTKAGAMRFLAQIEERIAGGKVGIARTRTFPVTAVGPPFPGTFDAYVGTLIYHWQKARDPRLAALKESGRRMGLFREIAAVRVTDTQIDVRIRAGSGNRWDSLPEAGHGVSQVLPVLVALQAAEPGQLVYVEHPESCLHPGAEVVLAEEFADAALRGVRLVAEIQSHLLLLTVQTLVAEGKLSPGHVKLHWFEQSARGETVVSSAGLDRAGAYGDWPVDLGMIEWRATNRYLNACNASEA